MTGQTGAVLELLKRGSVTPRDALKEIGCMRLAARIEELRKNGYFIHTQLNEVNGKRFARYTLLKGTNHGRR